MQHAPGRGPGAPGQPQTKRRPGRPNGELCQAIAKAAAEAPGTVNDLAARALVGRRAAAYTVCRMVARGELVELRQQRARPTSKPAGVYGPPEPAQPGEAAAAVDLGQLLHAWFAPKLPGPAAATVPAPSLRAPAHRTDADIAAGLAVELAAMGGRRR